MRRDSIAGIAGGILLLLMAGVHGTVDSWAAAAKAAPPKAAGAGIAGAGILAAPPPTTAEYGPNAYIYRAAGKSDPFRPFVETDPALLKKKQEEQSKKASPKESSFSPLQQAELWSFRLVGIAGDQDRKTAAAIVEDETRKKFYPLFVGTYIGLNGGRVASILPDRVIVEEPTGAPAKKGQKAPLRRIPIMLHKDQEEGKP
jgi:type IV pilus assembly protein PilP